MRSEAEVPMALVAPSILAADWSRIPEEVQNAEAAGCDMHHLDVMDGSFVPPITFGASFVAMVKRFATKPLDVHLMIQRPELHLDDFANAGASIITVHVEACPHLHRTVQRIHELGCQAGVALNPATPIEAVSEIAADIDLLLVMTVNPGWGGQKFISRSEDRVRRARSLLDREASPGRRILLEVDGGINDKTGPECVAAGADVLVAGSYIYGSNDYSQTVGRLKR